MMVNMWTCRVSTSGAVLVVFFTILGHCQAACTPRTILLDSDRTETVVVNYAYKCLFNMSYPTASKIQPPARITVETKAEDHSTSAPEESIIFVVYNEYGVMSWNIPYRLEDLTYTRVSRTFCSEGTRTAAIAATNTRTKSSEERGRAPVYVSLATTSKENVSVHLRIQILHQNNFFLTTNQTYQVPPLEYEKSKFTPTEPWYYQYDWPNNKESNASSLILRIHGLEENDTCMTLSIQNKSCPLLDTEMTVVQEGGYFQTIDQKGGLIINKKEFPFGFYVVFILNGDDDKCTGFKGSTSDSQRDKRISFILVENEADNYVTASLLIPLAVFIAFSLSCILWACCHYDQESFSIDSRVLLEANPTRHSGIPKEEMPPQDNKTFKTVHELAQKHPRVLRSKSRAYMCQLLTVAVFYALPVAQLMLSLQTILKKIGNQDECYYNFLCAHPVTLRTVHFSDFNHLFSNIGYVILGALFCFVTWRRARAHSAAMANVPHKQQIYGIPQQYGHFYALGLALLMEGVLSGLYHLCPNQINFQFDTSFMYTISVLCMVKLYTNRHPDVSPSAYLTFFVLATIILAGMIGIVWDSYVYFFGFTFIHFFMVFWLSLKVYKMGQDENNENSSPGRSYFRYPNRFYLLATGNFLNVVIVIVQLTALRTDFGSYLLFVLLINLGLYFSYYIFMKYRNDERLLLPSWIYMAIAATLSSVGYYYFLCRLYSTQDTPSISRRSNMECMKALVYYDNHDLWHFLSAGGLFFIFMLLITLDDDVGKKSRLQMPAF